MSWLKAVILDWAGTVLDHGSRAPLGAFAHFGVTIGDLPAGRPSPLMMWHAMAALGVGPPRRW